MLTPERRHEKRIVMDDFGFDHADAINLLIDTKNNLEIAVKALERLEIVCNIKHGALMKDGIKHLVEDALKKIRGGE